MVVYSILIQLPGKAPDLARSGWQEKNIRGKRIALGERPLTPPMNRTTSMSQLGSADFIIESEQIRDPSVFLIGSGITSCYSCSNKPIEPAHFLDACRLCNRRLSNGRDIYMYRGDTAFCSVECRQHQIDMDERKEKSAAGITGMKKGGQVSSSNRHENSNKDNFQAQTETVVAAWWKKVFSYFGSSKA